ncbi:hypothetical protein [Gallibacterium anatis]|uniref:hypothetical protein n=1 Tax=Gallibacterium anatis TaxID=750 RepID=UPI00300759B6
MDTQTNKTNKFVSIIVSLITNVFFALGYCLKFVLPPLVILVKIIVAIFSLVFHLGSKSSSDDDYQETSKHKNHTNFDKNSKTTTVCGEVVKVYNLDGQHPYYGYDE